MATNDQNIDPAIHEWIASRPGPFEAKSRMAVWCMAYGDYRGGHDGFLGLGFMASVNRLGFVERCTPSGFVLEVSPKAT